MTIHKRTVRWKKRGETEVREVSYFVTGHTSQVERVTEMNADVGGELDAYRIACDLGEAQVESVDTETFDG